MTHIDIDDEAPAPAATEPPTASAAVHLPPHACTDHHERDALVAHHFERAR